ncbi:MAG: hypothetical protein JWM99_417 [Verrucomicrobiales bacterium]|nr:hypothetical protein [Verrucomicrobiales bacterium]
MNGRAREYFTLPVPFIAGFQAELARLRSEARLKEVRRAEQAEKSPVQCPPVVSGQTD